MAQRSEAVAAGSAIPAFSSFRRQLSVCVKHIIAELSRFVWSYGIATTSTFGGSSRRLQALRWATPPWTRPSHPTRTSGSRYATAFRSFGSMFPKTIYRNALRLNATQKRVELFVRHFFAQAFRDRNYIGRAIHAKFQIPGSPRPVRGISDAATHSPLEFFPKRRAKCPKLCILVFRATSHQWHKKCC